MELPEAYCAFVCKNEFTSFRVRNTLSSGISQMEIDADVSETQTFMRLRQFRECTEISVACVHMHAFQKLVFSPVAPHRHMHKQLSRHKLLIEKLHCTVL